jgi:hypothetical protein
MSRKMKSAVASAIVAVAVVAVGGAGASATTDARGPLYCCAINR